MQLYDKTDSVSSYLLGFLGVLIGCLPAFAEFCHHITWILGALVMAFTFYRDIEQWRNRRKK